MGPPSPGVGIATPPTERNVAITSSVPGSSPEVTIGGSTRESVSVSGVGGIKTKTGDASSAASAVAAAVIVLLSCGGRWICVGGEGCGLGWTGGGGARRGRMIAAVVVGGSYACWGAHDASRANRSGQDLPRMRQGRARSSPANASATEGGTFAWTLVALRPR